jgi:hypothetical protein
MGQAAGQQQKVFEKFLGPVGNQMRHLGRPVHTRSCRPQGRRQDSWAQGRLEGALVR